MRQAELITAIVTPFDRTDQLDFAVLEQLTDHLMRAGTDGFVIGGTTGEGPALTADERQALYTHFATYVNGRAMVIANVGTNNTYQSVLTAQQISQIPGIDALLVVVPYYNKPDQAGMVAHFTAIADAAALPLIIYNIPGRTGVNMAVETVATLAQHPNIVGIKQCGELADFDAMVQATPAEFAVWTGEDPQFIQTLTLGGAGVISVASHLYAAEMRQAIQALRAGDLRTVTRLQHFLLKKMAALFNWPSPAPVKAALGANGLAVGSPRLPLLPLTADQEAALAHLLGLNNLSDLALEGQND